MANQPARTTSAGTRDVDSPSQPLTEADQKEILESDSADNSIKGPGPDTSGRRVRAIPAVLTRSGDRGTTVEVTAQNFADKGIDHEKVVFDLRNDNYTLPVGDGEGQISEKAADYLTKNHPLSFEYINED